MKTLANLHAELAEVQAAIRRLAPNGFCPRCLSTKVMWRYYQGEKTLCRSDRVHLTPHRCETEQYIPTPQYIGSQSQPTADGFTNEEETP